MRIGIDLGGTKIEAIALSPAGQEIARLRVTTPRDYAASLDAIAGLVRELERAAGAQGTVGVGIPGTVVPRTGLVKNANSTWLNGQPLERDLEGDRKSTRLNSSHGYISYAVFCLKKKKQIDRDNRSGLYARIERDSTDDDLTLRS